MPDNPSAISSFLKCFKETRCAVLSKVWKKQPDDFGPPSCFRLSNFLGITSNSNRRHYG